MNEKYAMHKIPADQTDERHLKNMRVTMWPRVFCAILLIVIVIAACWIGFGWIETLIGCIVLAIFGVALLVGYGSRHSMTDDEVKACEERKIPGHDIFEKEDIRLTGGHSYDFDCAPSDFYPYLAQMNLVKAGFYSFQVLERLFTFHIVNDYSIRPEWQEVKPGDWLYYHQNGTGTGVFAAKENEYICTYSDTRYKPTQPLALAWRPKWIKGFAWSWNFNLIPTKNGEGTHFITSSQVWWPEDTPKLTIVRFLIEWGLPSNFMINRMAANMGKLAERDAKARREDKPRPGYNFTK